MKTFFRSFHFNFPFRTIQSLTFRDRIHKFPTILAPNYRDRIPFQKFQAAAGTEYEQLCTVCFLNAIDSIL